MVELATRMALGERLADLGWPDGLLPAAGARRGQGARLLDGQAARRGSVAGPGMQSTGEVIGLHADARVALAKALLAASLGPPVPGAEGALALVTVADRDKAALGQLAAALARGGYRLAATTGTAAALRGLGHDVQEVARLGEVGRSGRTRSWT